VLWFLKLIALPFFEKKVCVHTLFLVGVGLVFFPVAECHLLLHLFETMKNLCLLQNFEDVLQNIIEEWLASAILKSGLLEWDLLRFEVLASKYLKHGIGLLQNFWSPEWMGFASVWSKLFEGPGNWLASTYFWSPGSPDLLQIIWSPDIEWVLLSIWSILASRYWSPDWMGFASVWSAWVLACFKSLEVRGLMSWGFASVWSVCFKILKVRSEWVLLRFEANYLKSGLQWESGNLACFKTFELQFEVLLLQCFDVRNLVCFKIFEVPGFNGDLLQFEASIWKWDLHQFASPDFGMGVAFNLKCVLQKYLKSGIGLLQIIWSPDLNGRCFQFEASTSKYLKWDLLQLLEGYQGREQKLIALPLRVVCTLYFLFALQMRFGFTSAGSLQKHGKVHLFLHSQPPLNHPYPSRLW
jgi:hypothetical protein